MHIDLDKEDITQLLRGWNDGEEDARNALFQRLYAKMIAAANSQGDDAASIVHDAFLNASTREHPPFRDRTHFAGFLALTLRNVAVDRFRRQQRRTPETPELPSVEAATELGFGNLDALQALVDLAADEKGRHPADAITFRVFGGLTTREISALTGRSEASVGRDLKVAGFFLKTRLHEAQTSRR